MLIYSHKKEFKGKEIFAGCVVTVVSRFDGYRNAGFKIEGLEKIGDKKFEFIFGVSREDADIKDAIASYWNKNLLVSAYDYFNNTKMLKSRIYSA